MLRLAVLSLVYSYRLQKVQLNKKSVEMLIHSVKRTYDDDYEIQHQK